MTELKVDFSNFQKFIEEVFGVKPEAKNQQTPTPTPKTDNPFTGTIEYISNFVDDIYTKNCKEGQTSEHCCKEQQEKPRGSKELRIEQTIENSVLSNLEKLELLKSDFDNLKMNNLVPEIDIMLSGFFYKIEEFCDLLFCLLDTGVGMSYAERITIFLEEAEKYSETKIKIDNEKKHLRKSEDIVHQIFLNLYIQYNDTIEIIYDSIKSDIIEGLLDA